MIGRLIQAGAYWPVPSSMRAKGDAVAFAAAQRFDRFLLIAPEKRKAPAMPRRKFISARDRTLPLRIRESYPPDSVSRPDAGRSSERDAMSDVACPFSNGRTPGQHFEQGALAGPVFTDQRHPLASFRRKIKRSGR